MTGQFVSYAQNFEDVRLWRAFSDVREGRYLDIGTQDPLHDSVSLAFYERGWRGVHVEPTPVYAQAMRLARPDEIVVQAAVSTKSGPMRFFEIPETGLSTGTAEIAQRHEKAGWQAREIVVPTVTLASLFDMLGDEPIHWLKIDVEGMEQDVLQSWGDHPARPAALVIEATAPNTTMQTHQSWYDLVLSRGYRDVLFDGLSRYFVHEAHAERGAALALSPNVFDGFNVTSSHFVSRDIAAERQRAVDDAVRQGAAEREAAVGEVRREMEERLAVTGQQLADERAVHSAQQEKVLALMREAGQLEGQLAAQAEHRATQVREAEAARREVLAQLATAVDERSAAQREVADLRVRIEALSGQHALELVKVQWAHEAAQAEKAHLLEATELAGQRIAALQDNLDRTLQAAARKDRLLGRAAQLLIEPADPLEGWPRKLATMLARAAGRRPQAKAARHAAKLAGWRTELAEDTLIIPDRTESPLAQSAPVAEWGHAYKDMQMFSDEGPITTVPRLLAPHDAAFIITAYQAVLGRAPDAEGGAYYLSRLRSGVHKLEILKQLRRSEEGRGFIPGVAGLDRAIKRHRRANMPILGALIRLATGAEGNGALERQMRVLSNEMAVVRTEQSSLVGAVQTLVERMQALSHQIASNPAQAVQHAPPAEKTPPKLEAGPASQNLDSSERRLFSKLRLFARTHGGFA